MATPRSRMALFALCFSVTSCAEQAGIPTGSAGYTGGLAGIGGPEIPGGSAVFRFGAGVGIRLDYETTQGLLLVRHYPADDSFEVCGGSQPNPFVVEQSVTDANFITGVILVLRQTGEVPVVIYPPADGTKDFCTYLAEDWLYKGTGRLLYHDNDLEFDPSRNNAFGWSGEGSVVDRNGRSYQYSEWQFISVDPETFTEHVNRAGLRLTPTN